jgi:hypothetical protein
VLSAVAYLDHRLSGRPVEKVEARFGEGQWHVRYREEETGVLPEMPDFEDAERLLAGVAERLLKEHPVSPVVKGNADGLPGFLFDDACMNALYKAEESWALAEGRAEAIRLAAPALASLVFQLDDAMEVADELHARAAAFVALNRALGGSTLSSRVILAAAMGYASAARRLAAELATSDPIAAYARRDDARLRELAAPLSAPSGTSYLWHRRLLETDRQAEATAFRKRWLGSMQLRQPLVMDRLRNADFETRRTLSEAAPSIVLLETTRRSGGPRTAVAEVAARSFYGREQNADEVERTVNATLGVEPNRGVSVFDEEAHRLGQTKTALGAGAMIEEYERASMFAALRAKGLLYLHTLSSLPRATAFAVALGESATPTATRFKSWYDYLTLSQSGKDVTGELLEKIDKLEGFGAAAQIKIFDELHDRVDWGSPVTLTAARRLIGRLDSRPAHRQFLNTAAFDGLLDMKLAESTARSLVQVSPAKYLHTQTWLARFTGDHELIRAALADPGLHGEDRISLLELEETEGRASSVETSVAVRRIAVEEWDRWAARSRAIDYFATHDKHDIAGQLAREWLDKNRDGKGLDPVLARVAWAKSLRAQGRNADALAAITPAADSWQSGAMYQAAILYHLTGNDAEAEKWMTARLERYAVPRSVTGMMELYFRQGRPKLATELLTQSKVRMRVDDWHDPFGTMFADVFVTAHAPGAVEAFDALRKAGVPSEGLVQIVGAVNVAKAPKLALELLRRIDDSRAQNSVAIRTYGLLRTLEGEGKAATGVIPLLKPLRSVLAGSICLIHHEEEVLWLLSDPGDPSDRELLWLFRAAAAGIRGDSPHRADLARHFETNGATRYHAIGRVVMGMEPEKIATALAASPREACEVAFYLGAGAMGQGRIEDASDWFRIALETNATSENEYNFAYGELQRWRAESKSLARIAAARRVSPERPQGSP